MWRQVLKRICRLLFRASGCFGGVKSGLADYLLFMTESENDLSMNLKRTFGTILTIMGIVGLIYAAVCFVQESGTTRELIVYGVLGAIFFFTGIGLVRNTGDVAKM